MPINYEVVYSAVLERERMCRKLAEVMAESEKSGDEELFELEDYYTSRVSAYERVIMTLARLLGVRRAVLVRYARTVTTIKKIKGQNKPLSRQEMENIWNSIVC